MMPPGYRPAADVDEDGATWCAVLHRSGDPARAHVEVCVLLGDGGDGATVTRVFTRLAVRAWRTFADRSSPRSEVS
jgi:hypothetical protein